MGSVLGGALSLGSALIGSAASKSAAKTQAKSANSATRLQSEMFNQVRNDLSPYRSAGEVGTNALLAYLGIGGAPSAPSLAEFQTPIYNKRGKLKGYSTDTAAYDRAVSEYRAKLDSFNEIKDSGQYGSLLQEFTGDDLENDPGYQFGMNQGMQALDRSAAARGSLLSGATLKAAQRFGQDYAGTKFNEAFSRDNTTKTRAANFLSSVAGMGQSAAAQTGAMGMQTASNIGNNVTGAGNALAAGQVGAANAWGNALGQIGNNYQQQQLLSSNNNMRYSGNPMANWGTSNGGIYGGSNSWG